MSFGLLVLDGACDLINGLELSDSNNLHLSQLNCLLDGYGWHPLSNEHDYHNTYQKVRSHLEQLISRD